ncbi:MAG: ABC transporter permease [Planctomycetota bacterium]|nr:ABC transporter permease [Planctomycetota bacterium]
MGPTYHIMKRELKAYFNTPIGYVFVVFFLLLSCSFYVFLTLFVEGVADMRGYFRWVPVIFLIFVPAVTMRLWAEERKLGTLELLLTFPVRTWQAVLGKFLAGLAFLAFTMLLTLHLPILLDTVLRPEQGLGLDWGPVIGCYIGTMVLGMVYLSVGAFASSLTGDQIVAFVVGATLNGVFFLIGFPPFVGWIRDFSSRWGPGLAEFVQRFGVSYHYESVARGVIDTRDLVYAVTVTGFFLFLNHLVIERRR